MLHLHQGFMRLRDEGLDHVLLAQPVAASHGIVEVRLQTVVRLRHCGGTPFGRHGMAAHGVDLGNQRNAQGRVGLGDRNGSAQSTTTSTDDGNINLNNLHTTLLGSTASPLKAIYAFTSPAF
jgi:hypothetical protein